MCCFSFFFFKQKTAYEMRISDWSSDVCSLPISSTIMGQKTQEQGADIGINNFMRGFGRIMNGLEAGAGDNALTYADDLSGQLQDEVTEAARKGAGTPVVDWARGLATPDEVAAKLASIQPLRLPPPQERKS